MQDDDFRHILRLAELLGIPTAMIQAILAGGAPGEWSRRLLEFVNGSGRLDFASRELFRRLMKSPPRARQGGARVNGGRLGGSLSPGRTGGSAPVSAPPAPPVARQPGASQFNPSFAPPLEGEQSPLSEEIFCGEQSSNVYSFAYDYQASTLFVTFWGHKLNPAAIRRERKRKGKGLSRLQLVGESGRTVRQDRGGRGSLYGYFDVPVRVFERMKLAASKGKFVWNELRIRGTIYGHRYRYSLIQGQVSTQRGVQGVYIARKATSEGFRTRSIADLGTGRRGFQASTLPEREFRTKQPSAERFAPRGPQPRRIG